jgi:ABC-type amino acid transport substrate-binding protein
MECNYAPFNWTQADESDTSVPISGVNGYADGYDVRLAKMIADGLGKTLVVKKIEWDGLSLALQSGQIDAIIAGMSPTEERKATIDFTDPYFMSDIVILVKKDSKFAKATSLADFSGAKITAQINTLHYPLIDEIPGVDKQPAMDTYPTMVVAVQSGKIDGCVFDYVGAVAACMANDDITFVSFEQGKGFDVGLEDVAVSVGLKKGSTLVGDINKILAGISEEQRQKIMDAAIAAQPLSE